MKNLQLDLRVMFLFLSITNFFYIDFSYAAPKNIQNQFDELTQQVSDLSLQIEANMDIVNVKSFGAVGDGVKDDTKAIQNSIEYAKNVGIKGNNKAEGMTVYLPPGDYVSQTH